MKILAGTVLALFLGLLFLSLFNMPGAMNMSHDTGDCPFSLDQEVVCPMNLIDHIGAWKSVFFTLIPPTFTLLLALGVAVLIVSTAPHLVRRRLLHYIKIHWQQLRHATDTYVVRPHQELFSSGILHPKLF